MSIRAFQTLICFLLLCFLQLAQAEGPNSRIDENYTNSWGEASNLQEKLGSQVRVSHRVSTAKDGFQTAYISISQRGVKTVGTAILIHGFDRDSHYWLESDFLKISRLLEQGYRVILPDLMVRGRTKELNFPLDAKKQWKPTDQQKEWLSEVNGSKEARYILSLLINEQAEGRDHGPLILVGHSRGALVTGYLAYFISQEVSRAKKIGAQVLWSIKALWSLNGFLFYTSPSLSFALESKNRNDILTSFEKLMPLQPTLSILQGQDIQPGDTEKIKAAREVQEKIPALMQSYLRSFEGVGEQGFVNLVMKGFEEELDARRENKYTQRQLYYREQELTEAMMVGLRTVYHVNFSANGLTQNQMTKNIMIPDSVVGIYRLAAKGKLPGIQSVHVVLGKQDPIIPPKLGQLVNLGKESKIHFNYQVLDTGHMGPEETVVTDHFRSELIAPSCQAIFP